MSVLRSRRIVGASLIAVAAIAVAAVGIRRYTNPHGVVRLLETVGLRGTLGYITQRPSIAWSTPTEEMPTVDHDRLAVLTDDLARRDTRALLIAVEGHLVVEWYAAGRHPDAPHSLAAAAKGLIASPILLALIDAQRVRLNQPAATLIPEWGGHEVKAEITIAHLVNHASGLDDVNFLVEHDGWQRRYYENRDQRLAIAVDSADLLFPPGAKQQYSGLAYYPLAYALAGALETTATAPVKTFFRERILQPLGVPPHAFRMSYNEVYDFRGRSVVALGSGASLAPRAALKIGQLFLERGVMGGDTLIDPERFALLDSTEAMPPSRRIPRDAPPALLGWWSNQDRTYRALPTDAMLAVGANHTYVIVAPSLGLVVARLGGWMTDDPALRGPSAFGGTRESAAFIDEIFLAPLVSAIGG